MFFVIAGAVAQNALNQRNMLFGTGGILGMPTESACMSSSKKAALRRAGWSEEAIARDGANA